MQEQTVKHTKEEYISQEKSNLIMKNVIQKHPGLVYFAITFLISWGLAIALVGIDGIPGTTEEQDRLLNLFVFALLGGPIAAGLIVSFLLYGKNGIREYYIKTLRFRLQSKWYVIAFLGAPIIGLITLLPLIPFSDTYIPAIITTNDRIGLIFTGIMIGLSAGLFEELGWTGFATPELRKHYSMVKTGLIIGINWGVWHFITAFWGAGDEFGNFEFVPKFLPMMTFYIVVLPAFRIIMVWVYENTKSLSLLILMHSSLTGNVVFILLDPELNGTHLFSWYLVFAVPLWIIVGLIIKGRIPEQIQT